MKQLLPGRRPTRWRLEALALLMLAGALAYQRVTPFLTDRALARASLATLVARSRNEKNNPRVFYYLGLRLNALGESGPARAAFQRAAYLDPDDEKAAIGWASAADSLGKTDEAFYALATYSAAHPRVVEPHRLLTLFCQSEGALERGYQEAITLTILTPRDPAAWRTAGLLAIQRQRYNDATGPLQTAVRLAPTDWQSWIALGDAYSELFGAARALPCYTTAYRLAPHNPAAVLEMARASLQQAHSSSSVETARRLAAESVRLASTLPGAHLALGEALERQNHWTDARRELTRAESLNPMNTEVHYELSQVDRRLGDDAAADHEAALHHTIAAYDLEKANLGSRARAANDPRFALQLARLCTSHGEYAEAARQYRILLVRNPKLEVAQKELTSLELQHPEAQRRSFLLPVPAVPTAAAGSNLLRDADALLAKGLYADAQRAYLRVLAREPRNAAALGGLGLALDGQGRHTDAFQILTRALALDPSLPEPGFVLAHLYFAADFPDQAARRMEVVVRQSPGVARYWHALGNCDSALFRYSDAIRAYQRAADLAPRNADYYRDLADAEVKETQAASAEGHLRRAAALAPRDPAILADLASFLLDHRPDPGRIREARDLLRTALGLAPHSPEAVLGMGRALLHQGQAKDAAPYLEEAVMRMPNYENAWYDLAQACEKTGQKDRAAFCRRIFRTLLSYKTELFTTEDEAHTHLKNPALRLKLARLYARSQQYARSINQYQMCLVLDPHNRPAAHEMTALVHRLQAAGEMPQMTTFNGLILASPQLQH